MLTKTVTIYETIKLNLFKWFVFKSMTLKKQVNIMSYNVAEYVIGWRYNGLHDVEKTVDLFQTIFVQFTK